MDEDEKAALAQDIRNALRMIIDPEIGQNIVDLGLIYDITVEEGGIARVTMTTTTRGCPATDYLRGGAGAAASSTPGVVSSAVQLTYDPPWTPEMMSPAAKAHLGIGDGGW